MYQQFLNHGSSQLSYMSSDELREIFGDDDKLDERIDQIVSYIFFVKFFIYLLINYPAKTIRKREGCDYYRKQDIGRKQSTERAKFDRAKIQNKRFNRGI